MDGGLVGTPGIAWPARLNAFRAVRERLAAVDAGIPGSKVKSRGGRARIGDAVSPTTPARLPLGGVPPEVPSTCKRSGNRVSVRYIGAAEVQQMPFGVLTFRVSA